jgi:hypothetical protein
MNRSTLLQAIRVTVVAITLSPCAFLVSSTLAQDAVGQHASSPSSTDLGRLELQLRTQAPDSPAFGQADGAYWDAITRSQDFPRAYSFFAQLSDEAATPDATLLAAKASAQSAYLGWLYQNHLSDQAGEEMVGKLRTGAIAEFKQALAIDPDNFSALYGYATFEGYRPGGQAHQKELLAKLDTLRASKPYLPWGLVDQLEKNGKPE